MVDDRLLAMPIPLVSGNATSRMQLDKHTKCEHLQSLAQTLDICMEAYNQLSGPKSASISALLCMFFCKQQ